jgi:hypothetical protein
MDFYVLVLQKLTELVMLDIIYYACSVVKICYITTFNCHELFKIKLVMNELSTRVVSVITNPRNYA